MATPDRSKVGRGGACRGAGGTSESGSGALAEGGAGPVQELQELCAEADCGAPSPRPLQAAIVAHVLSADP